MGGGYIDRARATALMRQADIDALVVLQPENFQYATGAPPGVAALFRKAGAAMAVIPADPASAAAAIVTDLFAPAFRAASDIADMRVHPIWVESVDLRAVAPGLNVKARIARANETAGRAAGFRRPETFDQRLAFALLAETLAARGLATARLGVELDFLPVADLALLQAALPHASFVDGADVIRRCRMIKSPREIEFLRTGSALAEVGITAMTHEVRGGVRRERLSEAWRDGVAREAARLGVTNLTGAWDYISVGPNPWGGSDVVRPGEPIKVDVGCVISGYSSDGGRTFVLGKPHEDVATVHAALLAGFERGLAAIGPGQPMSSPHAALHEAMHAAGFTDFTRGHVGHSVGQSVFSEEWPFLSAANELPFDPGMMIAFEAPLYLDGLGGFIIEDQMLVTASGIEIVNRLPRTLVQL
jgi:Xaa-Pro aminopeptidase